MTVWGEFTKGILAENPLFRVALGLCPALAVTTSAINGFWMGLATAIVLLGSNLLISLVRGQIPSNVRIPAFVVVIASFVTIVDLTMFAYVPDIHSALGIFIPLIVSNCLILGRAEIFAAKHGVGRSVVDALGMGVGFLGALVIIGAIRELLGAGSIFGFEPFGPNFQPSIMMILPPGGFLTLGILLSLINWWDARTGKAQQPSGGHAH